MKQKSVNKSHTGSLPGLWNHSFNKCLKCYCNKVEQSPFSKRLPQQGKPLGKCQPRAIYFKYFHSHGKRLFLFQTSVVFANTSLILASFLIIQLTQNSVPCWKMRPLPMLALEIILSPCSPFVCFVCCLFV